MESNGEKNRIHVSQKTADLIQQGGKGLWLTARPDKIHAKGKGEMQTYWCLPSSSDGTMSTGRQPEVDVVASAEETVPSCRVAHSTNWIVDLLARCLNDLAGHRMANPYSNCTSRNVVYPEYGNPINEISEVLSVQQGWTKPTQVPSSVALGCSVVQQLDDFVTAVVGLHRGNPFHNLNHCGHVVLSTKKLLDSVSNAYAQDTRSQATVSLDPLTQLAVLFSALVHDVDHYGISNAQLVVENANMADMYNGKSVAEQNSIDKAWNLLLQPRFDKLRECLFATDAELQQFRQLLVNMVLATDLFDPTLQNLRLAQWNKAFGDNVEKSVDPNVRATCILQLIIQASDVSHTMQHFTVYKKWNMCLLEEMYLAFSSGRSASDPTDGWYDGELRFFDNYVIPLAKKMQTCGAFGVAADEFLDYTLNNRLEWEAKGRQIVELAKNQMRLSHRSPAVLVSI
jgi:3'5'-cyclic nucleotide phosphodiesterase